MKKIAFLIMLNFLFRTSVCQLFNGYKFAANPLNCSLFGVNATEVSPLLINWQSRLHSCFLSYSYDTTQLPVPSQALPLVIYFDWALFNLLSFQDGIIAITYQISITWMDYLRSWNPIEIPISSIQVPIQEIWHPQFFIMEANDIKYISALSQFVVVSIYPNGLSLFNGGTITKGKCSLNLLKFPFDIQTCKLTHILQRFHDQSSQIDVVIQKSPYAYRFKSIANDEWEILSTQTNAINLSAEEYKYRSDGSLEDTPFITVEDSTTGFEVTIRLRRYSNYYVVNIICPLMALALLDMLPFAMEDSESEKLVTAVAVVSSFMFLQGIVANLLPKSDVTPNLAIYVAACLIVSAVSVIPEVFCYSLCYRQGEPSSLVQKLVLKGLGVLLYPSQWIVLFKRWKAKQTKVKVESVSVISKLDNSCNSPIILSNEEAYGGSWREVTHALNRFFALLHVAVSLTLAGVFLAPILAASIYE